MRGADITVSELIEELNKMPMDSQVIVVHPNLLGSTIKNITINDDKLGKNKTKIYIA